MNNCLFCDIVKGNIPSWVVYQSAEIICFLPSTMEAYGHTLIAPKAHYADIYSIPATLLATTVITAQKLSVHYQSRISSTGINLLHASGAAAQQSVFHFHLHLIPRFKNDELNAWPKLSSNPFNKDEIWNELKFR
jgi:histidine triad (HIT) family protein